MAFFLRRNTPSVLRSLRTPHAEACARVHAGGFAHPWSKQEFAQLLADSSSVGVAALDPASGRLRGFCLSRVAADEAEILTIAVDPTERKRGVGRELLHEHLQQAAFAGARQLFLEVDEDNAAALALYRRFGFAQVGQRAGYYRRPDGRAATALILRRALT